MNIGVISDIHNNAVALDAVLDKLQEEQCEHIICCGDMIGMGPYPEETVQRLMRIPNLIAVLGNHDRCLTEGVPTKLPYQEKMSDAEAEHHRWEHSLLSDRSKMFIRSLPCRRDITLGGVRIVILHYGMDGNERYFPNISDPGLEDCRRMFSDIDADVILFGHDHIVSINRDERTLYVGCGSVGCSAKGGNTAIAGILTINNRKAEYEPIKVQYDVGKVIADIERLAYPSSEIIKKIHFSAQ